MTSQVRALSQLPTGHWALEGGQGLDMCLIGKALTLRGQDEFSRAVTSQAEWFGPGENPWLSAGASVCSRTHLELST